MSVENNVDKNQMDDTFDKIVKDEIGEFGKYQIVNIGLICLIVFVSAFLSTDYVFIAAKLNHRCLIPECDYEVPDFTPSWIFDAIPTTNGGLEDCRRYANRSTSSEEVALESCPVSLFDNNSIVECESYVYENTNSIVYDFSLECKEWLRALVGTLSSVGVMIALLFAGYISDNYGRRVSVVLFSFNIALFGVIKSFSVNYTMFLIFQVLHTVFGGGVFSAGYILATEIVGTRFRVLTGAVISSAFAIGLMLLGFISSQILNWRTLGLVLYAPVFLSISYYWLLTESFRWLITKRKDKKATDVLSKAASMNGKLLTEKSADILINFIAEEKVDSSKNAMNLLVRVVKSKIMLKRCLITPIWWMATTFIYYGLSINSVSLSGNMYTNFIATAAVEIPGNWTAVLLLNWIGRKATVFSGYLLCSLCCTAFIFIPEQYSGLALSIYLIGKFGIALVFTTVYLYTFELYPTCHRHSFLGFCSMMGRVGSILAPLTPPLIVYWYGLPSALFSIMSGLSAILVLTQPETLGTSLPDTFEEAENIGN